MDDPLKTKSPAGQNGLNPAGLCSNDRVFLLWTTYDWLRHAAQPYTRVRHLFAHKPLPYIWRPP